MESHYGYIKRTDGADGGNLDVFVGAEAEDSSLPVFVVNQVNPTTGKFDEHKVLMGFETEAAAEAAYLAEYDEGWQGLGDMQTMDSQSFKEWVKNGDLTVPAVSAAVDSKFSNVKPGQLAVPLESIPDTVTVDVVAADGTTVKVKAKEAISKIDKTVETLNNILSCVNS